MGGDLCEGKKKQTEHTTDRWKQRKNVCWRRKKNVINFCLVLWQWNVMKVNYSAINFFYCTLPLFYELWSEFWLFILELHIFTQFHYFTLHNHISCHYCNNVRNISPPRYWKKCDNPVAEEPNPIIPMLLTSSFLDSVPQSSKNITPMWV